MVLHGDLAQGRERGAGGQHPLGEVRVEADPLGLGGGQRPGLVPDRVGDPEPAEVVDAGRRDGAGATSTLAETQRLAGAGGEVGDAARVAEGVGRLDVDEVGEGRQRQVELTVGERALAGRAPPAITASHVVASSRSREQVVRVARDEVDELRVELGARALSGHLDGALCALAAVVHLEDVGQVDDPGRQADLVAARAVRRALAVPPLEGLHHRRPHAVVEPEPPRPTDRPRTSGSPASPPCRAARAR